jgi:hypothetical protein
MRVDDTRSSTRHILLLLTSFGHSGYFVGTTFFTKHNLFAELSRQLSTLSGMSLTTVCRARTSQPNVLPTETPQVAPSNMVDVDVDAVMRSGTIDPGFNLDGGYGTLEGQNGGPLRFTVCSA